jgi:hypothetical protein
MTDLTTLANFKAYANVTVSTDDSLISDMITGYSAWIQSYLSRNILSQSYTIVRSGRGGNAMQLPNYPITAVSALTIDGIAIPAQPSFGQYGYRFDDESIVLDCAYFTIGRSNISITYTAGFATVPPDLAKAANELIALRYKERDRIGFSSKTLAGETVAFITKDMPAPVATILKQYVRIIPT